MPNITKRFVESITPDPHKLSQYWDKSLFSMQDLARDYIERHGQKKREKSLKEDQKLLRNIIMPSLGSLKVAHVSSRDIESLHLRLKNTPYQANRVVALLSKMFSLAVSWGWRADNPAQGIEKYQEEKRDRWLNDEELQRLWSVLDKYSENLTAYVFKFLLLTGARKGEALQATWDQFDLEKGLWIKPAHLTKQKKKEYLPLSDKTLLLLEALKKRREGTLPYIFPGKKVGEPLKEVKKFWGTVLKQANLKNVRIHDLRHTHASTTQRYAHLADEPLRKATDVFGKKVDQLMSEGKE